MLFQSAALLIAASFARLASADYIIDPESVDLTQREYWCQTAMTTCPLICQQMPNPETIVNECNSETLTYGCLCGDNVRPNISEYSLTIPYFTCMEWGNQCVKKCGSNNACSQSCREDNPCGAQNPKRVNVTTVAGPGPSATEDSTTIYTNSESNDKSGAVVLAAGQTFGLGVVLGSMFLGFALL